MWQSRRDGKSEKELGDDYLPLAGRCVHLGERQLKAVPVNCRRKYAREIKGLATRTAIASELVTDDNVYLGFILNFSSKQKHLLTAENKPAIKYFHDKLSIWNNRMVES